MTRKSNVWPCCQQPFGDATTSCTVDEVEIPGVEHNETFPSVRYDPDYGGVDLRCHDCHITRGSLHHPGCDMERCPKCGGQLIGCGCLSDEAYSAWQRTCADLATANATIAAHETDLAATAELLLREQALAESRSLALATMREAGQALVSRSPFFITINHGADDVEICQFCLEDGRHTDECPWPAFEQVLAQPDDAAAAALAGAVMSAAAMMEAVLATALKFGDLKPNSPTIAATQALDAYRRARAALRGGTTTASTEADAR